MITEEQYNEFKKLIIEYENNKLDLLRKERCKDAKTTIPQEQWGVHANHCCFEHGCKYGYDDCPVELGLIKQEYDCELCGDDDF